MANIRSARRRQALGSGRSRRRAGVAAGLSVGIEALTMYATRRP
jgi:hypothetical protein